MDSEESKELIRNKKDLKTHERILFENACDKKIKEFKNSHGDETYFVSDNPKEIIFYSEHILNLGDKLRYLNYITTEYMNEKYKDCEFGDKIHKTFFKPLWKEIKKTEEALEDAANGNRFLNDIFYIDVIELLANSKKALKERLELLLSIKEELKETFNIYSTIPATKYQIKTIINKVEDLIIDVEKDVNRNKLFVTKANKKIDKYKKVLNFLVETRDGLKHKRHLESIRQLLITVAKEFNYKSEDGVEAIIRNHKDYLPNNLKTEELGYIFSVIDEHEINIFIDNLKKTI